MGRSIPDQELNLHAGELVEVRSEDEILATLDDSGRLNAMPFMPEMLKYCGKRFRVYKIAHKTCDNIQPWNVRQVKNAVHLTGVRCDGRAHGDCDAGCLIFWNAAWLKRAVTPFTQESQLGECGSSLQKSAVDLHSGAPIQIPGVLQRASRGNGSSYFRSNLFLPSDGYKGVYFGSPLVEFMAIHQGYSLRKLAPGIGRFQRRKAVGDVARYCGRVSHHPHRSFQQVSVLSQGCAVSSHPGIACRLSGW